MASLIEDSDFSVAALMPSKARVTVIIFVSTGLFLRYHRIGRAIYAVGGNREAARLAGIPTDRRVITTYVVSAGLAAVVATGLASAQR